MAASDTPIGSNDPWFALADLKDKTWTDFKAQSASITFVDDNIGRINIGLHSFRPLTDRCQEFEGPRGQGVEGSRKKTCCGFLWFVIS